MTSRLPVSDSLEHDRLTSLINSMADGVLAVDRFTNIVVYNGAALNILDVNTTVLGQPLSKFMHVVDANNQPVDIVKYVRGLSIPTIDDTFRLRYHDGSQISLYLSVSPVAGGFGTQRSGFVIVLRDITRTKTLEEERDEFISVVSHELRTPIAIAEGNISNAQLIADQPGGPEKEAKVQQALEEAHSQITFLASLINDLSTLSRAERGKLVAEIEQINVPSLLSSLSGSYTPSANKKGLQLYCKADPRLELLASSPLYVREILQNFITNAIKYTEHGSVTISAAPYHKNNANGVLFSVSDTGIGISRGDQERVFDKFFRSEDYRTRSTNGTGLGLYITMKLARLLHADIDVDSQLNRGSTFMIFVPNLS